MPEISRRNFVQAAGLAAVPALAAAAEAQVPRKRQRIAVSTYSYWHFTPDHQPRNNKDWLDRGNQTLVEDLIDSIGKEREPLASGRCIFTGCSLSSARSSRSLKT